MGFTVPALLQGIVVGGSALSTAPITLVERRTPALLNLDVLGIGGLGPFVSAVAGWTMVGWMTLEIALIGLGIWVQATYFAVGLVMIGLAILLQRVVSQQTESRWTGVNGFHHAA